MNWLLPTMTKEAFQEHLVLCDRLSEDAGRLAYYTFTPRQATPSVRPQPGEHLFVRVGRDVVGWHSIISCCRAFEGDGRKCTGWQVRFLPTFHELDAYQPAPTFTTFGQYHTEDPT